MWVSPTVCGIETPPVSTFSPLVWEFRSVRSRPNPLPPRSLSADHIVGVGQYKLRKPSSTSREVRPRTGRDRRQRRRTGPPRVLHRSETASRPLRSVRRASRGSGGTPRVQRVALEGGYNVDGPTRPVDRARRRPRGRRRSRNRRRRGEHGTDAGAASTEPTPAGHVVFGAGETRGGYTTPAWCHFAGVASRSRSRFGTYHDGRPLAEVSFRQVTAAIATYRPDRKKGTADQCWHDRKEPSLDGTALLASDACSVDGFEPSLAGGHLPHRPDRPGDGPATAGAHGQDVRDVSHRRTCCPAS